MFKTFFYSLYHCSTLRFSDLPPPVSDLSSETIVTIKRATLHARYWAIFLKIDSSRLAVQRRRSISRIILITNEIPKKKLDGNRPNRNGQVIVSRRNVCPRCVLSRLNKTNFASLATTKNRKRTELSHTQRKKRTVYAVDITKQ